VVDVCGISFPYADHAFGLVIRCNETNSNIPRKVGGIQSADRTYVTLSISSFEHGIYINYQKDVHLDQLRARRYSNEHFFLK
jgi:hypothetical protein